MTSLANLAIRLADVPSWVAIETNTTAQVVEDLVIELDGIAYEAIPVEALSDADILELDRKRVRRVGSTARIFVGPAEQLTRLARLAPHSWSLVGPDCWKLDEEPFDVEARLRALRQDYGMQDAQVLEAARQGRLTNDPVWAEWLALLGQGDLLGT